MEKYVKRCLLFEMNKVEQVKYLKLLQPWTMSNRMWKSISMDFVVDFFRSQKDFDSILIVDRLAKVVQFIPTTTTVTTLGVA